MALLDGQCAQQWAALTTPGAKAIEVRAYTIRLFAGAERWQAQLQTGLQQEAHDRRTLLGRDCYPPRRWQLPVTDFVLAAAPPRSLRTSAKQWRRIQKA